MRLLKRVLAGVSALAMLTSSSSIGCYTVFAEDDSQVDVVHPTTSEAEEAPTQSETTLAVDEPTEPQTESTSLETEQPTTEESVEPITEEPTKGPAPSLNINIPDQWKTNIEDWNVTTSGNAVISYIVSDSDNIDDNAYSGAKEWNVDADVPEGDHYIRFWSMYPDGDSQVAVSNVWHYRLDKTSPSPFTLSNKIDSDSEEKKKTLIISNAEPITDEYSGIGEIYYTISNQNTEDNVQKKTIEYTTEEDGSANFSFAIEESLKDSVVTVYVTDRAGNSPSVATYSIDAFDSIVPVINNISVVNATFSDDDTNKEHPNWSNQTAHKYGHEKLENESEYIYVSDESYLKVSIQDNYDQLEIKLSVDDTEVVYSADELKNAAGNYSTDGTYYIPLNDENLGFVAGNDYKISITANDSQDTSESMELSNSIFFDPNDGKDSLIKVSLGGNYVQRQGDTFSKDGLDNTYNAYFGKTSGNQKNQVSVSISDDIGLASYNITVNGETWKSENLYDGVKCEGSYSESEGDSITVTYQDRAKTPEINPCIIPLESNGVYDVVITVVDLAGNRSVETRKYVVDTAAPVITGLQYKIEEPSILHYLTFGIYGNQTITIRLTIEDDAQNHGSGVPDENIVLYWADDSGNGIKEYHAHREGGEFVFESLVPYGKAEPYIVVKDRMQNESKYYFGTVESGDEKQAVSSLTKEAPENEVLLILETNAPEFTIVPTGTYETNLGDSGNELYFGALEENLLNFEFTDDEGLDHYHINIKDQNGNDVFDKNYSMIENATAAVKSDIPDSIKVNFESGKYTVSITAVDLAGNEKTLPNSPDFNYPQFYVDTIAPTVDNVQYNVTPSLLKYFSFGIFGNETISLSVHVNDNDTGCGVKKVTLYWAEKGSTTLKAYSPSKVENGEYVFADLSPDSEAVPYIVVSDFMDNTNTYYFTTVENDSEEKNIGKLILDDKTSGITLALEDDAPTVEVTVPSSYTKYTVNGEIWYPGNIEYNVAVIDDNSGLNKVTVKENDKVTEETAANGVQFISTRYKGSAEYIYPITEANDYHVSVTAADNAGNESKPNEMTLHIDKEDPQIVQFQFGDQRDNGTDYERGTYGFYFMTETEARVYVNDPGITSGYKGVTLFLTNVDGQSSDMTVSESNLYTDTDGTYASFIIPMGFKGKVVAEVVDNVEHTSGLVNADGNIIEDDEIHSRTSSIDIKEDVETDKTDADNVSLYNRNIPLTITVQDTFSGISTIEWSVANDGESGVISVANDGSYQSDSAAAIIGGVETESNLITSMQFAISVDNNSNGNVVTIKLTDRSGNTSESSKIYSIDTTVPTIQASFGNTSVQNGSYYKDAQTVNITITERNFNGSDVVVTLNGAVQNVGWDDSGSTVGQDSTEHHASFNITADGDYTYEIRYTDRAGNEAATVTSSQFTIDAKEPTAEISFDVGDDKTDDVYYKDPRKATFIITEHNYASAVISIAKDGKDVSGTYNLDNWSPRDHFGDNHSQTVELSESGYYQGSITVTDKAGNTFQTTSKKFYIDLSAPKVSVTVDNVENGAPSNEENITPFIYVQDDEGNLDIDSITLKITSVKLNENLEIVSNTQILTGLDEWEKSTIGSVEVDNESHPNSVKFDLKNIEDDGIYTFEVAASDLAGNPGGVTEEEKENGAKYKISVNRLGSTYEVDSQIADVDPDLRYYRNDTDKPFSFTIKEYNVNTLDLSETIVKMTCDGTVVDNNVTANEDEDADSDKWSIYTYDFPSEIMTDSGKYIVKLYSVDAAGNENPLELNGDDERATVTFFIDNVQPEVYFRDANDKTEFTNEDPYKTDSKKIEVEVYDNSQQEARDVVFELNGETLTAEHVAGTMIYTLEIPSRTSAQSLSVSLKDIAGNETRAGVDNFLITTNLIILWFKNTPVFVGTILGLFVIIGGIIFVIIRRKRKN